MNGDLAPGSEFAGYRIRSRLGSGSSGTVYLAGHPRLPRWDALKVLSASDATSRARFLREAETVARLDHPNIVAVHDRGVEHGRPWIAMRFVDGIDAAELIRRGPSALPLDRVARIVEQVAHGVDAAHAAGVLHRDVKPANILIETPPGEPDRVFVTDFGIAHTMDRTATGTGAVLGTVAYAAPEQLSGGAIDGRADVYGLGCTLYELLTGTKPFPRPSVAAVMHAHLTEPPPRATALVPALPSRIDDVLARALAKDPGQRFPTCGALAAATAAALAEIPSPAEPVPPPHHRRPRLALMLAGAAVVAALVAAGAVVLNNRTGDPPPVTAPATTVAAPTTAAPSSTPATSWGSHWHTVSFFPGLLPQTQDVQGYKGIRCSAVNSELQPVSVDEPVGDDVWLTCRSDGNPVERLTLNCFTVGGGYRVQAPPEMTVEGEEKWQRPSGTGRLIYGTYDNKGLLLIDFDKPSRSSCGIGVVGLGSGRALYEQWWPDAPL